MEHNLTLRSLCLYEAKVPYFATMLMGKWCALSFLRKEHFSCTPHPSKIVINLVVLLLIKQASKDFFGVLYVVYDLGTYLVMRRINISMVIKSIYKTLSH